ncbi:hypothetical protein [Xylophilus sp.]|uniref:hypothetical protein n=1 Tax=Xylophilus sp. TaxID=2653893 RepID=UPI0013B8184D|nr:hypothetical protein [Xylophilus sp.]KAF1045609.1 MAG: hypothetical protein GAK38_02901 [Xylophilus sp.]
MSAFSYATMAATASRLLKRFGAKASISRIVDGSYDPATGNNPGGTQVFPTVAAIIDYEDRLVDGTMILRGDLRALMDPRVQPIQGDRLTWKGKSFAVISVKAVSPAGLVVLYDAQVRG